nr:COGs COG3777 [uncultured bacterium]
MTTDQDEHPWQDWVGRTMECSDLVTPAPLAALAALLDSEDGNPASGFEAPPLSHWLCFAPMARQSELGEDGHPRRSDFLPPITLPRRIWAAGRLTFHKPIRVDDEIRRVSRIQAVAQKRGRSGDLAFVTVRHEVSSSEGLYISEEQDIVYKETSSNDASGLTPQPERAPDDEQFSRTIFPDPVLLFRYSAVTSNGHRIHYDRSYAAQVGGYPGLVVHGSLIATLLLDLMRRECPEARVRRFDFKAVSPLFDSQPFSVCGRWESDQQVALWARNPERPLHVACVAQAKPTS